MHWDYLKHLLVRTRFETALMQVRAAAQLVSCVRHPELFALEAESALLDQVYARILRRDSNCIDVGAHLGLQLSQFVRLAPLGRHMAFEPVPQKARWLHRKFPDVEVFPLAVGERQGAVEFYVNAAFGGCSGLSAHGPDPFGHEKIEVSMVRLDDFSHEKWVDFLKVDVEGHELGVLKGATSLLARCRPYVLFESTKTGLSAAGRSVRESFAWFEQQGYALYLAGDFLHEGYPLELREFERSHDYPFRAFNFIAVPAERVARSRPAPEMARRGVRPQA